MLTRLSQAAFFAALLPPAALLFCASCGSTPDTSSQTTVDPAVTGVESVTNGGVSASEAPSAESAREVPDFFAPKPWTGAFTETAVMLADTVRIEGPEGLLDHVASASDDEFYERTAEVTADGFRQTIRRLGPESPEIRVRIDRWTMAATQRVVILENVNAREVTVIAGGEALWRDVNGHIATADRLEFVGEIGQTMPVRPTGYLETSEGASDVPADRTGDDPGMASEGASDAAPESSIESNLETNPEPNGGAPAQEPGSDDANSAKTESENIEGRSSSQAGPENA